MRQSMAWIHTWLGLLAGWILFAMFLTGTASYFRPEITRWMQPELRFVPVSAAHAADAAVAHLESAYPGDEQWYIYLPDDRAGVTRVFTRARPNSDPKAPPAPRRPELMLDPATGSPLTARETRGGEHFYRFHFQLQLPHPWGRWLVGLCAMFMLSAIISGVITHKRFFADFFTLRWRKGQRSWLDAHNVSAVLALPFHAMITYTGLFTLVLMYMPWPMLANYKDPETFASQAYGTDREDKPSGRSATLAPLGPMVDAAIREWHGKQPRTVIIRNPGDDTATVTILRGADQLNARAGQVTYSGATGVRLDGSPPQGPAITTAGVMLGLHMAKFAGPVLRWSAFLLGLTGTAMVGTGLLLWTAKRRKPGQPPFFGFRLVERLNIGAVACLPAGMAAFFLANRLIPSDLSGRADMEVSAMFWTWFGLAALSLLRPVRRAWVETLALSALAFAAVPVANALSTDRGLLPSLRAGDWLFVSFDLAMLAIAATLGFAAARARDGRREAPRRSVRAPTANASNEAADAV
ncbi:PepSY-associated TM helix domain-containing protein [Novosphingobium sp. SL115]|uniref:PepSY-associated TM helix domain-containing protein n=1 Tax=Novosphingobium sp. SL115 TaxID=2995150 RepID=UPI00227338A3|nr:PepSY-associated TM helix domain-containing protein [Novosphingobium sp. SL115]MCY1669656.1 PepSY-associated TM helix domain-containing protein [Novosphingobium sp. SL115]